MSLGVNRLASSTTWVDSALLGSQAEASFCWALFSLPARGPATANTAIQKTSTPHLLQRPPGSPAIRRAQPMTPPTPSLSYRRPPSMFPASRSTQILDTAISRPPDSRRWVPDGRLGRPSRRHHLVSPAEGQASLI